MNRLDKDAALVATAPRSVRLTAVSKSFGATKALHDTGLYAEAGTFLTLLGPSGCGKSTILNLIAGFLQPDTGDIFLGKDRVTDLPPFRRNVGLTFQSYALFPHMSVAQNVGYGLKNRGLSRADQQRRTEEALALVKLDAFADRRPSQLSGGQQQRVALARAIVFEPRVLLLDEPFSALDKNLRGAMQVELRELQQRLGITTIFVTHDQSEALSLSDTIAVMSDGRIRQTGAPDEIYRRPADPFVTRFVGEVNEFVSPATGPLTIRLGGEDAAVRAPNGLQTERATLFVRPEAIGLVAPQEGRLVGTVAATVYQGAHVDVYLDVPDARGRVLVHTPAVAFGMRVGEEVGLAIDLAEAVAFDEGQD
ncbi:MAG: ABC transporter ATP-binding protein [Pseudomonadota bacterium]